MNCSKCNAENAKAFEKLGNIVLCIPCMLITIKAMKDGSSGIKCEKCESVDAAVYDKLNKTLCKDCCLRFTESKTNYLIAAAREIDNHTVMSGDWYNAKTIAFEELHRACLADESIEKDKREYTFTKLIAERIDQLNKVMFERSSSIEALQDAQNKDNVEKSAALRTLQDFVSEVRAEVRAKIKESDDKYIPPVKKPVKVRQVDNSPEKKKETVFERAVQALSVARGITLLEARLILENGGKEIR